MATKKLKKPASNDVTGIDSRMLWWSDLNSTPISDKNELFCAMSLYFMKKNSVLFLDPKRAIIYRGTDSLQLDERLYKEMVDPTTPMGGGGKASYFSSDWKANPSYLHVKNIVKARMQKLGKKLTVELNDKYSKGEKLEQSYRILYRQAFRRVINEYAPLVGLGTISDDEDPYKWVADLSKGSAKDGKQNAQGQNLGGVVDNFVDLIKNKITDSQDLTLFSELIYKSDYEAAFELGIKYFLNDLNKWDDRYSDKFIDDVMHFNKVCGEWYTDQITGRPVVEYLVPERLWVSPFKQKDGEDLLYYFIEYDITFAEFVKTMGRNMDEVDLKRVFDYQKTQGSTSGMMTWASDVGTPNYVRDNAMIRIGKAALLSQDISVYMDDVDGKIEMPLTWKPMNGEGKRIEKYYNVWYNFKYIPPTTNSINNSDYQWQSRFIFDIQKNQDQFRYGEDGRYSKSPLVIYDNSTQASFTDITQYYMTKIHHASHKFDNCLVNDLDAVGIADDFLGSLLSAVDEDNKINPANPREPSGGNGVDAAMEQWKMIKQGGAGFLKMRDKVGNQLVNPAEFVIPIKNGYLEKAEKYLTIIALLYNDMSRALALSPVATGEQAKPRTPVAAIEESLKATEDATFFIEKSYEAFIKQYGEICIQYIIRIAKEGKEGYPERWTDFQENVGYANSLAIEGMAEIPPEALGMTVEYVDTVAQKQFIMQLATEYAKIGKLSDEFLFLIMTVDNYKIGMLLMRIGIKQAKKEAQEEAATQQQYIMQQKQMDLQIAQAQQQQKTGGKIQEIQAQAGAQSQLNSQLNAEKFESQKNLKAITTQNRITEAEAKMDKQAQLELQQGAVVNQ